MTNQEQQMEEILREMAELKQFKAKKTVEEDIAKIQAVYPDFLYDETNLPEQFVRIMATGAVDALTACEICRATAQRQEETSEIGAVGGNSVKDFFSSGEVDRLTEKQLKDPKVMGLVMKSMAKWK